MDKQPLALTDREPARAGRPRVGFLGVGWIGRHRLEAIARSGLAEVAAIADPSDELARAALEIAGTAERAGDLDDLLRMGLDGVVIATPSALHAAQAARALESGLAVYCQKPLARTAAENQRVIAAARAADRLLGVDLAYRHVRGLEPMREAIANGELGKIFAADLVFHNAYSPDKSWYYERAQSGGGCVMDLGLHLVDLALWMLGWPKVNAINSRLFSQGRAMPARAAQVEDYAVARLDLEGHSCCLNLACSWRLHAGRDAMIEATFYGTQGGLSLRNLNGSFYDFRVERLHGAHREMIQDLDDGWGARAAVTWAARLAQGRRYDPEVEHLVEVARALDGIYGR